MLSSVLRRLFSHVIVHVTNRCDLRCATCFVTKGQSDLTLTQARTLGSKLGAIQWLDIGGGEPFLHSDLPGICGAFHWKSLTIPTNGQQPDVICRTVRSLLEMKKPITIALSLDGFQETNDAIRGAGSFAKALETFHGLRAVPEITLKINTVVSDRNLEGLTAFMGYVRESLQPDYHSLLLLRGFPSCSGIHLPPAGHLRARTQEILSILATYIFRESNPMLRRMKQRYQRYLWNVSLATVENRQCYVPCRAPIVHRVIYPDGRVAMCELTEPVGNLLDEPLAVIDRKLSEAFVGIEQCKGACYCTHNCNMGENILMHPRSVAKIILGRTDA